MRYGIATDYNYAKTHKRDRLTIWSGAFSSDFEGEAYSLPNGDGYMISLDWNRGKVKALCPVGRNDDNYQEIDDAINFALNAHFENGNK